MTHENKQRLFNYFHELTDGKVLLMEEDYMFIENTIRPPKNNSEDVKEFKAPFDAIERLYGGLNPSSNTRTAFLKGWNECKKWLEKINTK